MKDDIVYYVFTPGDSQPYLDSEGVPRKKLKSTAYFKTPAEAQFFAKEHLPGKSFKILKIKESILDRLADM